MSKKHENSKLCYKVTFNSSQLSMVRYIRNRNEAWTWLNDCMTELGDKVLMRATMVRMLPPDWIEVD